jgi:cell division protein FtsL
MGIPLRHAAEPRRSTRQSIRPSSPESVRSQQLAVVPGRRRAARFAIALTVLLSSVMMGAVYLHTRIAERQLEIDQLERSLRQAQVDFDVLRADRADLRSLTRLSAEAIELGMQPAAEGNFIGVDPILLAVTIARTGEIPATDEIVLGSTARLEPLDQFRLVKAVSSEAP